MELDVRELRAKDVACCSSVVAPGMTDQEAEATARVLKALADPTRVRIVNLLSTGDDAVCVCDLTPHLGLAQPTVSFHLKKLLDAGLLRREQRGVWAFYSLERGALGSLRSIFEKERRVR